MEKRETKAFIKEHLLFLLTIFLTYALGFLLALIAFFFKDNWETLTAFEVVRSFAEAIIPTTITYVLVCSFENIIKMMKIKTNEFFWNLITLVALVFYLMGYTFYQLFWDAWLMIILELIFTVLILISSIRSYKETYVSLNRNHNIIPT